MLVTAGAMGAPGVLIVPLEREFGWDNAQISSALAVATRWFTARRGLVVGLLSASSATGQLVFLPLIASLTDHLGWRLALVFVCGLLGLAALLAFALMRDRPGDLNLPPYGEREIVPARPAGVGLISLLSAPIEALRDALRVPLFWVLFATFFICGCSTNGLIQTHFITFCGDYGLPAVTAAGVLAMMGVIAGVPIHEKLCRPILRRGPAAGSHR
jgi:MFS family permease